MKTDYEILDEFVGKEKTNARKDADQTISEYSGRTALGEVLSRMHVHGEECEREEIVYREADIIRVLEFLGYSVKFGDE